MIALVDLEKKIPVITVLESLKHQPPHECLTKQVVPDVVKCLHDQDPAVRKAAATALGQLGERQAASELVKLLNDQDVSVVTPAAR